jgi:hypothetical protein
MRGYWVPGMPCHTTSSALMWPAAARHKSSASSCCGPGVIEINQPIGVMDIQVRAVVSIETIFYLFLWLLHLVFVNVHKRKTGKVRTSDWWSFSWCSRPAKKSIPYMSPILLFLLFAFVFLALGFPFIFQCFFSVVMCAVLQKCTIAMRPFFK